MATNRFERHNHAVDLAHIATEVVAFASRTSEAATANNRPPTRRTPQPSRVIVYRLEATATGVALALLVMFAAGDVAEAGVVVRGVALRAGEGAHAMSLATPGLRRYSLVNG